MKKKTYHKSETKWISKIELTQNQWRKFTVCPLSAHKVSKFLEYQLLQWILATNHYLHRVEIVNSSLCYFCQQTQETIEHRTFFLLLFSERNMD